jgi:hypothetical protein
MADNLTKVVIITKKDGNITTKEDYIKLPLVPSTKVHLCSHCANLSSVKCIKVSDVHKKRISAYAFITDGQQIIRDKKRLVEFLVTGCKNYQDEKARPVPKSLRDDMAESLRMAYFGANSTEEADELQKIKRKRD